MNENDTTQTGSTTCEGDDCSVRLHGPWRLCNDCREPPLFECRNCNHTYADDHDFCPNCNYASVEARDRDDDSEEAFTATVESVATAVALLADKHDGDVPAEELEAAGEVLEIANDLFGHEAGDRQ
ncbi:hypothetical protein [Haloferax volcanii]|uniref:Uncharacterized protein n=1 Tax=Haloferax volcanii JCM 10717 TaxID=1227458 RepID=M0IDQ7_HALVO|nr:hypothetical protein [Haloferax alexandrinus]ELZ93554.1 hypothetical protein C452_05018 [Haloferax alexandrinus JCM 10717]